MINKVIKRFIFVLVVMAVFLLAGCGVTYANSGYVQGKQDIRYDAQFFRVFEGFCNYYYEYHSQRVWCVCGQELQEMLLVSSAEELLPRHKMYLMQAEIERDWDTFFETRQFILTPPLKHGSGEYYAISSIVYCGILTVNLQRVSPRWGSTHHAGFVAQGFIEITRISPDIQVVFEGGEIVDWQ